MKLPQDQIQQFQLHNKLRLGARNIRSMLQLGKVQLLEEEIDRLWLHGKVSPSTCRI